MLIESWEVLPVELFGIVVDSMPRRVRLALKASGGPIIIENLSEVTELNHPHCTRILQTLRDVTFNSFFITLDSWSAQLPKSRFFLSSQ